MLARCRPFLDDPLAVQGKLCRCIERFIKELFVFVAVERSTLARSPELAPVRGAGLEAGGADRCRRPADKLERPTPGR